MTWMWTENRPLLRALLNYAIVLWKNNKIDKVKSLMSKIINMNPNDNQGIRYFLLGIYEGMKFEDFEKVYPEENLDKMEVWYNKIAVKYDNLKIYIEE